MAYIEMKNCYKRYQVGDTEVIAVAMMNFEIEKRSQSLFQKTSGAEVTVLNILGGMDTNDDGHVFVDGVTFPLLMATLTYYQ